MTTAAPSLPPVVPAPASATGLFVVGLGGSTRPESSTERIIRAVLDRLPNEEPRRRSTPGRG
jgi:hypothetical protein